MLIRIHSNHVGEETRYKKARDTLQHARGNHRLCVTVVCVQQLRTWTAGVHDVSPTRSTTDLTELNTGHLIRMKPLPRDGQAGDKATAHWSPILPSQCWGEYVLSQLDLRPAETTLYRLLVNPEQPLVQSKTPVICTPIVRQEWNLLKENHTFWLRQH